MRTDEAPTEGIGTMADAPRVFLSYSHDSDEHADRVLQFADQLRQDGIDAILDQYEPFPEKGWTLWMEKNVRDADWVLMVCTETYHRRVEDDKAPAVGRGVRWEGRLIRQYLYDAGGANRRFVPVLLQGGVRDHIPSILRDYSYFSVSMPQGYEILYRLLTDQPWNKKQKLGKLEELPPRTPLREYNAPYWNVPYPRNPNFAGRLAILRQLETALASGAPAALSQAIAGMGGVGKTQTAVEYAYLHRDQYRAVLWVRADTETDLASGYRVLAEVLGLLEKDETDSTKVVAAVRRWLGREPGYLLILDNADDPDLVKPYLPPDPRGQVLLTSRAHNFHVLGIRKPIELPVLTPDEAPAFLLKRTDREGLLDPAEQAAARTLAGELGYLPLALEQAAAYMVEHEEAFSVYLAAYRALRLKLLDAMGPVTGEYPETVRTTWERSFAAVAAAWPASIALLRLSSFLAPDAIPYELIVEGVSELGEPLASALTSPPGGEHALNTLLAPLARHSLVRYGPEARTYSVHRLVQVVLLDALDADTRRDLAERAVRALNRIVPEVDFETWPLPPRVECLLPHALAAREWIERECLRISEAARLLKNAGWYLHNLGRCDDAEPLFVQVLAIREAASCPNHPDTAQSLNDVGVMIQDRVQDRYREAELMHRLALAIREKALGPDHPDTAISLNNLARALQAQGRYAEAVQLFHRAVKIREKAVGPRPLRHGLQPHRSGGGASGPGPVRRCGVAAPPGAGNPREGERPQPPRHGPLPLQPGAGAPGPGPVRQGGAAVPPGGGDPRGGAGPRPLLHGQLPRPLGAGAPGPGPVRRGGAAVPPGAGDFRDKTRPRGSTDRHVPSEPRQAPASAKMSLLFLAGVMPRGDPLICGGLGGQFEATDSAVTVQEVGQFVRQDPMTRWIIRALMYTMHI